MDKPYRPSNGTEGMMFMDVFCDRCKLDNYTDENPQDGCDILARTLGYGIDDKEYPKEWIWSPGKSFADEGLEFGGEHGARCTAFESKEVKQ